MRGTQIRWGILGSSFISEVMANAIKASRTSDLVAIGSRSLTTAKQFAAKFSIPFFYDDYQTLLEDDRVDAVYIGLPNHLHKEWIIRCALAKKNILCEKPFVISTAEALEVLAIIEKANVFCMEALMYRCHPLTKKLCDVMQNKLLGELKIISATYTANISDKANPKAGGSIRNLGCYPVSLIRLLTNAEPIAVQATGRLNPKNQTDHQASAIFKFQNDAIAVVSTADDIAMNWQFDIYGTAGRLQMISNPWLPDHHNQFLIYRNDSKQPIEINVTAEKPLYTYQIDTVNANILNRNSMTHDSISLHDSLGNISVLENWHKQVHDVSNRLLHL